MPKYSEYDYMYAAAKIAAVSCRLCGKQKLYSFCDASSVTELAERLAEIGMKPVTDDKGFSPGLTLDGWLCGEYDNLLSYLPSPEPVRILRSRYDCHNIKTAIKCRYLGVSPDGIFIDCGNVSADNCRKMAENHDFFGFSANLKKAAEEADRLIDGTHDARCVDVLLDRACFAEMKAFTDSFGFEPATKLLALKTDMTNVMSFLRTKKIKSPEKAARLLADSCLTGGNVPACDVISAGDTDELCRLLNRYIDGEIAGIVKKYADDGDTLANMLDREFLSRTKKICGISQLGAYPVCEYVISLEYQVKNLRIIMSGVGSGTDPDTIRERLRA